MIEHPLTTYIRTKTVFKNRLKDLKDYSTVKVYVYELDKLGYNYGPLLWRLRNDGEIWYDSKGNFKALRKGPVAPELLALTKRRDKVVVPLTPLHEWMRDCLHLVELPIPIKDIPVYFKAFLEHRDENISAFFSVDAFSSRVHTPVVNLKGDLRFKIIFDKQRIVSLDVKQMQPTILAKVLLDGIGVNSFSTAIFAGEDVYVLLQKDAGLASRKEAKKYLFQLIFGKPMDDIGKMFKGDQHLWVDWINNYKSREEPRNPHKESKHTNLAWLLQYSEVRVMTCIWASLKDEGIPFLTIHDDILCRADDKWRVYDIMERELKLHFPKFEITISNDEDEEEKVEVVE